MSNEWTVLKIVIISDSIHHHKVPTAIQGPRAQVCSEGEGQEGSLTERVPCAGTCAPCFVVWFYLTLTTTPQACCFSPHLQIRTLELSRVTDSPSARPRRRHELLYPELLEKIPRWAAWSSWSRSGPSAPSRGRHPSPFQTYACLLKPHGHTLAPFRVGDLASASMKKGNPPLRGAGAGGGGTSQLPVPFHLSTSLQKDLKSFVK